MLRGNAKWLEHRYIIIAKQNVMKQRSDSKEVNNNTGLRATVDLITWAIKSEVFTWITNSTSEFLKTSLALDYKYRLPPINKPL